jgi:O-succinylbenzoate-CoA ligase
VSDAATALERSRYLTLGEIVSRTARRRPDHTALMFVDESRTFAELDERMAHLAGALVARGVQRGDRVAILMFNCVEFVETFLACHRIGACAVPINFRLAATEVQHQVLHSGAKVVVVDAQLDAVAREAIMSSDAVLLSKSPTASPTESLAQAFVDGPWIEGAIVTEDELAFLMYTSGTTGVPKAAMLTHRNLVTNTTNWLVEVGVGQEDVWFSGLPLFHIGGINGILPFLYTGGTAIITPSMGFDAAQTVANLAAHDVTICFFVPTQWEAICESVSVTQTQLPKLARGLWGGSQCPLSTLELIATTLPRVGIYNAFGQTEMSSNTCFLKPEDSIRKRGSVGKAVVNVEVRIVDEGMNDVTDGTVGEIVYRGPTVMKGYFNDVDATAAAFEGGWFHSGDLVVRDADGYITVVDRLKDMIISGGENIYPAEVERVLLEHPAVTDVAVVGVPHPKWVETPIAVVVCAGSVPEEDELIEFVKGRIASYKKPSRIIFVDELPRNAAGKVLRRTLREEYVDLGGTA